MATDATPDDLDRTRTDQGFDAYVKTVARLHGETAARAAMTDRTPAEQEATVTRDRRHLEQWRSTPEGETDYQETRERVLGTIDKLEADGPARAAG
ncbi:MAG: hypothetical protein ACK5RL_16540 [Acidimicrobiales bacterium]